MPVNVTHMSSLSLLLDGQEVNCQLKNVSFSVPSVGSPSIVLTACPDGQVVEPGSFSPGSLSGEVVGDTTDTGITWLLNTALQAQAEVAYVLTFFDDQGAEVGVEFTGTATVNSFAWPFSRPGVFTHSIDLSILTATVARPA